MIEVVLSGTGVAFEAETMIQHSCAMEKFQQFLIPKVADPFTILKLFQTLRRMEDGECLELLIEGTEISDKLRKILSVESCEMSRTEFLQKINQCIVVVTKKMPPCDSGQPKGDCCCD